MDNRPAWMTQAANPAEAAAKAVAAAAAAKEAKAKAEQNEARRQGQGKDNAEEKAKEKGKGSVEGAEGVAGDGDGDGDGDDSADANAAVEPTILEGLESAALRLVCTGEGGAWIELDEQGMPANMPPPTDENTGFGGWATVSVREYDEEEERLKEEGRPGGVTRSYTELHELRGVTRS